MLAQQQVRPLRAYVDLREELYDFVGDLPEDAWGDDSVMCDMGNPHSLAGHAVEHVAENAGNPEEWMRIDADALSDIEPWDKFYLETVYRVGMEVGIYLTDHPEIEVGYYSFDNGILQIDLAPRKDYHGQQPETYSPRGVGGDCNQ